MSRGLGAIERLLFQAVNAAGKSVSYAELIAGLMEVMGAPRGTRLAPSKDRSFRRALHGLVRKGFLLEIGRAPPP
jgi:hypothetical protein